MMGVVIHKAPYKLEAVHCIMSGLENFEEC